MMEDTDDLSGQSTDGRINLADGQILVTEMTKYRGKYSSCQTCAPEFFGWLGSNNRDNSCKISINIGVDCILRST